MKESIINSVQDLRKKKAITQEEFADKIGVSRQTVIAIEKGNYTPSVLLAIKIARFFGKKVEEVFEYVYEK
jgi:putative transcriptional regulator